MTAIATLLAVDAARLALLRDLSARGYQFATPAPSTYRRVRARRGGARARDLADVFGWSLPFAAELLDGELFDLARRGEMLVPAGGGHVCVLRVGSVGPLLLLHSASNAQARDAVFLGPDSQRFASFIAEEAPGSKADATVLDIGCGTGVGGLVARRWAPDGRLILSDRNPAALRLAAVNAAFAEVEVELLEADGAPEVDGPLDLVVANPPYVGGGAGPLYSHGGGRRGEGLSVRWAQQAVARLAPGGRLLLYTGSAIARGHDALRESLAEAAGAAGCALRYRELDPDVFPGLLLRPAYWGVERIAAVGAVLTRPS